MHAPNTHAAVTLDRLTFTWPDGSTAIDSVSGAFNAGRTGLVGRNGSGKSTLLKTVNLLERVDDGQIFLAGDDITDPRVNADRVRARIGVVFQHYNLFPHMS
ncbi:MAG TPA: hypothetical protein DIW46_12365, partial [Microbacterium sp.]|nr:hypothetical protein [Microbacterium sp.]